MKLFLSLMGVEITDYKMIVDTFDSLVDGYHLDIMDGEFVPSKTVPIHDSYPLIKKHTIKPLWLHLMTTKPYNQIETLARLDQTIVSFHIEIIHEITKTIFFIKEKLGRPSLAISPGTSIFALEPFLNHIDHITVMSVNPGASGQKFIPKSIATIQELVKLCNNHNQNIKIACDGGINETNIAAIKATGVSDIALSNAIFKYKTPLEQIKALETIRTYI